MRFLSINRVVCASACVFAWSLGACVAPGTLDNKEAFAKALGAGGGVPVVPPKAGTGGAAGAVTTAGAGGAPSTTPAPGCPMGCTIIAMRCGVPGCHTTVGPAGMLDLMSPDIAGRLAGKASMTTDCAGETLLDATMPDKSLIYTKVKMPAKCGLAMPPTGGPLSADEVACMQKWVAKPTCP